ncbi:MAG: OmpA family protein [Lewinella sp.]
MRYWIDVVVQNGTSPMMRFLFFLTGILSLNNIYAQCADIYFYRVNGFLQSELKVYLMQNGDIKGFMDSGERYHATVCTAGNYEFVAKIDPDLISLATQTVQVEPGGQYYIKLGVATGVDMSSIKLMDIDKGKKEFNKGSKFTSPVADIQLEEYGSSGSTTNFSQPTAGMQSSSDYSNPGPSAGNGLMAPVETNNFRFEVTDMRKSGELLELDYKITNLAREDRALLSCPGMVHAYDDIGNLYISEEVCISNSCRTDPGYQKVEKVNEKFYCNGSANAIMPSSIPLNAKITFRGISRSATKFARINVRLQAEQDFEIRYASIDFPGGVDVSDPNKKIAGNQTFQLVKATRKGQGVLVKINAFNRSTSPHDLSIKGGQAYDDMGNVLAVSGVAFGSPGQQSQNWSQRMPGTDGFPMYIMLDEVPAGAQELSRLDINFGNYELRWDKISLEGEGEVQQTGQSVRDVAAPADNAQYISYVTFRKEASTREKVAGKKIILDDIYFDSGSDALQSRSYTQLQELATLLQANPDLVIEISGHTDNVGTESSNTLLSQKRADAVRYYLIERSVTPTRMTSVGYGLEQPIDSNSNETGRQKNRRVEIKVGE